MLTLRAPEPHLGSSLFWSSGINGFMVKSTVEHFIKHNSCQSLAGPKNQDQLSTDNLWELYLGAATV